MIDLKILGAIDLRDAGGTELRTVLVQPKRFALLSYLVVARPRGFHQRESLLPIFWPELSDSRARHALRQSLHFLRQALGKDVIRTRGSEEVGVDRLRLRCDAVQFEEHVINEDWEHAVALYDGTLLNAVAVNQSHEFERWVEAERLRLGDSYVRALDGLVALSHKGDHGKVVAWLRRRAEHDPYDSEITLRLMRALESANDRPGAQQLARAHQNLVMRDLGAEPDQRISALATRLADSGDGDRLSVGRPWSTERFSISGTDRSGAHVTPEGSATRPWAGLVRWGLALTVIAVISWFAAGRLVERTVTPSPVMTLIVAPFVTLTDSADQYLADGIAEGVLNRLSDVASLRVIGWVRDDVSAADTLSGSGIQYDNALVLRASVQRDRLGPDSSRVRVLSTVTRARDQSAVWRTTIDHDFSDIMLLDRDVATSVIEGLGIHTLADERAALGELPTLRPEAYEQYLMGIAALERAGWIGRDWTAFGPRADFARAVDHFQAAFQMDSTFVLPLARLAITHTSMFHWNFDRTSARLALAKDAMDQAMQLRPDLQVTHLAAGWYYYLGEFDYNRALRHLRMVNSGWAGSAEAMLLTGGILRRQGDLDQALVLYARAEAEAGLCPECRAEMSYTYYVTGDIPRAEESIERALALSPELHLPRHVGAMLWLTEYGDSTGASALLHPLDPATDQVMHLARGRWASLHRILSDIFDEPLSRLTLDVVRSDTGGFYLAKAGLAERQGLPDVAIQYYDSARTTLERLVEHSASDPLLRSELGLAYAGLGNRVAAIREGTMAVRLRPISHDALDGPIFVEALAEIYMKVGEFDAAVGQLEELIGGPGWMSEALLRLDPLWEPLCGHPRFASLTGASPPT
jgi:DNA-binding SARP family transcriptional activator/tetratricopeptide (TPR) repeat protein